MQPASRRKWLAEPETERCKERVTDRKTSQREWGRRSGKQVETEQ